MKTCLMITACLMVFLSACTTQDATTEAAIYVFESGANGFNTKTVFYDDGKEVVAFDAQFTAAHAQAALDFIRSKTSNPVKYLVVSHPNPDKFNGIPTFQQAGAQVIASKQTIDQMPAVHQYKKYYFVQIAGTFTDATYPSLPTVDISFEGAYTLNLANGGVVELKELNSVGVSSNQTIAAIPSLQTLVVGDLIHHQAHAWLEGPIVNGAATYSETAWIQTLQTLKNTYNTTWMVYGGRGTKATLEVAVDTQITYLQQASTITQNYINGLSGATLADKKQQVDYMALQQLFEQAFPSYALGYMINYGAYGLIAAL